MVTRDPDHLALLRSLPCAVPTHPENFPLGTKRSPFFKCTGPTQAHHRTGAGMALKASDHEAFPLCLGHHAQFHNAGGIFREWTREQRNFWQDSMCRLYCPDEEVF